MKWVNANYEGYKQWMTDELGKFPENSYREDVMWQLIYDGNILASNLVDTYMRRKLRQTKSCLCDPGHPEPLIEDMTDIIYIEEAVYKYAYDCAIVSRNKDEDIHSRAYRFLFHTLENGGYIVF